VAASFTDTGVPAGTPPVDAAGSAAVRAIGWVTGTPLAATPLPAAPSVEESSPHSESFGSGLRPARSGSTRRMVVSAMV